MRLFLRAAEVVSFAALATVSLLWTPAIAEPLVDRFSPADGEAYVEAAVRSLGNAQSSLADRDYAVKLLGALGSPTVASGYKSSACSAAAVGLGSGDLAQIHHGISLEKGVGGCSNTRSWRASELVAEAMKSVDLWSLYHAVLAAPLLGADVADKGEVLEKVMDLVGSDGTVRSYPDGPVEAENASMAAELLAVLVPSVSGAAKAIALRKVEAMKEKALGSEPSLVVQLNHAAGDQLFIKAGKLKSMARNLLEASRTSRPKSMLRVYEALKAIEGYSKAPLPIKLLPASPSVVDMANGGVSLLVTSLLGSHANVASVSLSSIARADGTDALSDGGGSGTPLAAPQADGSRAIPAVDVTPGVYTAVFSVEVKGAEKPLTAKLPIAIGAASSLAEVRVSVSESKDRPSSLDSAAAAAAASINHYVLAKPGHSLLPDDAHAIAAEGHHVHVELSLKGVDGARAATAAPHQVFVRFTHADTGLDTFFVAAPVGRGEGAAEFAVSVSLGEESQTFLQRSGAYGVTALVGGPLVMPPISVDLGAMDLLFPDQKERTWPIYARALLHETDVSLGPLPEKHHTFREPEVRPHAGVSLLFTALALSPLVGLAYGMRWGGANLRRMPSAGAGRAWCAAYQACMVGCVLLFVTYWATLTMAYTLRVLAVLSVVTTLTGRKALQSLAAEEEEEEEGERGGGKRDSVVTHTKVD